LKRAAATREFLDQQRASFARLLHHNTTPLFAEQPPCNPFFSTTHLTEAGIPSQHLPTIASKMTGRIREYPIVRDLEWKTTTDVSLHICMFGVVEHLLTAP
jgi:hypothetical protein